MRTLAATLAVLLLALGSVVPAQVVRYVDGVFVAPRDGAPIELIAYAEMRSTGVLRMQEGTLEDVPHAHEVVSVLTSIPNWRPHSVTISTAEVFRDERAERRNLVFSVTRLNVYALGLRISDLERRERIDALLESVRASYGNPGFLFIGLQSDGYVRYYMLRLTPLEPGQAGLSGQAGCAAGVSARLATDVFAGAGAGADTRALLPPVVRSR